MKCDTRFRTTESNLKMAIVLDMWLTGFYVHLLDTSYDEVFGKFSWDKTG